MKRHGPPRSLALVVCMLAAGWLWASQDLASILVRDTTKRMLAALEQHRGELDSDPRVIYRLVGEIVVPAFDFQRITRSAVGRHWRHATAAQRAALVEEFQKLLVRTYATALLGYSGQEIRFLPLRPGKRPGDVAVLTEVQEAGGTKVPIAYRLYLKHGAWKVYDVAIDGVSLVSNYRSSFAGQIRRHGIDGLVSRLKQRNGGEAG